MAESDAPACIDELVRRFADSAQPVLVLENAAAIAAYNLDAVVPDIKAPVLPTAHIGASAGAGSAALRSMSVAPGLASLGAWMGVAIEKKKFGAWKLRWVTLNQGVVYILRSPAELRVRGSLERAAESKFALSDAFTVAEPVPSLLPALPAESLAEAVTEEGYRLSRARHFFAIEASKRTVAFGAMSDDERRQWIKAIHLQTKETRGQWRAQPASSGAASTTDAARDS